MHLHLAMYNSVIARRCSPLARSYIMGSYIIDNQSHLSYKQIDESVVLMLEVESQVFFTWPNLERGVVGCQVSLWPNHRLADGVNPWRTTGRRVWISTSCNILDSLKTLWHQSRTKRPCNCNLEHCRERVSRQMFCERKATPQDQITTKTTQDRTQGKHLVPRNTTHVFAYHLLL